MTTTVQNQKGNVMTGLVVAATPNFVPASEWPELEAAREAHERVVEEYASVRASRAKAREEERQLEEHIAAVRQSKRETLQEADTACKAAVIDVLQVVGDRGAAWLQEIADARAEALRECAELSEKLAAAETRAHRDDAVEAWIKQATSSSVPQAFGQVAA